MTTPSTEGLKPDDIAAQMANVMFNLAQKAGHTLTSEDCALFNNLRKQWDATRRTAQASEAAIRNAALEEAANVCENEICTCCWDEDAQAAAEHLAQSIRALSTTPAEPALTLETAPIGTKAPAINGGHWSRVERGWKWCTGATFSRPGGDWNGELIVPAEPVQTTDCATTPSAQEAQMAVTVPDAQTAERILTRRYWLGNEKFNDLWQEIFAASPTQSMKDE